MDGFVETLAINQFLHLPTSSLLQTSNSSESLLTEDRRCPSSKMINRDQMSWCWVCRGKATYIHRWSMLNNGAATINSTNIALRSTT